MLLFYTFNVIFIFKCHQRAGNSRRISGLLGGFNPQNPHFGFKILPIFEVSRLVNMCITPGLRLTLG